MNPIDLEIYWNRLIAIVDEAGVTAFHAGAPRLVRIQHRPVAAVQHREDALHVEVAQPLVAIVHHQGAQPAKQLQTPAPLMTWGSR